MYNKLKMKLYYYFVLQKLSKYLQILFILLNNDRIRIWTRNFTEVGFGSGRK